LATPAPIKATGAVKPTAGAAKPTGAAPPPSAGPTQAGPIHTPAPTAGASALPDGQNTRLERRFGNNYRRPSVTTGRTASTASECAPATPSAAAAPRKPGRPEPRAGDCGAGSTGTPTPGDRPARASAPARARVL
jgi:hypothetical protein